MGGESSDEWPVTRLFDKGSPTLVTVTVPAYGRGWKSVTKDRPALKVTIKSSAHNRYLTHCSNGRVEGDRTTPQAWEEYLVIHVADGVVAFKSVFGTVLTATPGGNLEGDRHHVKEWKLFTLEVHGDKYAIKSYHGKYVCLEAALPSGGFKVVADRPDVGDGEQFYIDLA